MLASVARLQLAGLRRLAVGPVDLAVAGGECVSIMGASGAGKSVLLRMIADLDPHDGEARVDGVACSAMPAPAWRHLVRYVPAASGWWAPTVGDHFSAGTEMAALLARAGLAPDAAAWPVDRLSTGERQRLALLRALHAEMRVLLLDEPTSGLDAVNTARMESIIGEQRALGVSILVVTHDPAQARRLATRHATLQGGRLEPAPLASP